MRGRGEGWREDGRDGDESYGTLRNIMRKGAARQAEWGGGERGGGERIVYRQRERE